MYFDALTAAAVSDQLRSSLCGGRVQQVVQVDEWSIALEVYAGHERTYVLASAHPQHSRVHPVGEKLRRGVEAPSPLLLLLRKYVRGGRIAAVRHPEFERIVELEIESAEGRCTLIVEAMGRHANVILVSTAGTVMEAIKRVGPHLSRVRPILPGQPYAPPPPQDKLDPTDLTELRLRQMLEQADAAQPAWQVLVRGVRGVSPLLAREQVHRAAGDAQAAVRTFQGSVSALLQAHQSLWAHAWEHEWAPCLVLERGQPVAFAPYALTQYGAPDAGAGTEVAPQAAIGEALERYYAAQGQGDAYAAARGAVRVEIEEAHQRVSGRRQALEGQLVPQEQLDRLRLCGEMILAYAYGLRPGETRLEVPVDEQGYPTDGPPLVIDLDPRRTAVENAQAYFERYEKAKAAAAEIPPLLARAMLDLRYLDQLATDLDLAATRPAIEEVRDALAEAGLGSRTGQRKRAKPRSKMQRSQPLRVVLDPDWVVWVGRSARQNHEVTFRIAAPDDLWLHAVDAAGAHVIVKSGGRPVPQEVLQQAASLAARYSALRAEGSVAVACTARRHVRPIRGAGPGLVTYRNEQILHASPRTAPEGI
jgi:predicted ribosome quality control (RQC) complex YloA/Tae2 family protein